MQRWSLEEWDVEEWDGEEEEEEWEVEGDDDEGARPKGEMPPKAAGAPAPPKAEATLPERADETGQLGADVEDVDSSAARRVYVKLCGWWEVEQPKCRACEGQCSFPGCPLPEKHSGPHKFDETLLDMEGDRVA